MCVASNLAKRIHGGPVAIDQMPQAHPGRELLSGALGCADLDDTTAERCRDVIASSGALASVEAAIDTAVDGALDALHRLDTSVCEPLTDLALYAAYRDR